MIGAHRATRGPRLHFRAACPVEELSGVQFYGSGRALAAFLLAAAPLLASPAAAQMPPPQVTVAAPLARMITLIAGGTAGGQVADIDRTKAEMLGVLIGRVFEALSIDDGSAFVDGFNILGRVFRVTAQAGNPVRPTIGDVANLRTRNDTGEMVPIGSVATFSDITGPFRVARYNLYPAAEVQVALVPGFSTGQGITAIEEIAETRPPPGFAFEWTGITPQENSPATPRPSPSGSRRCSPACSG